MVFRYRCSNWDTHHEHPLASWQGPFGPHSPKLCQAAQMSLTPNFVWKVCSHRGASSLSQKTRHVSTDWWLVCVCARYQLPPHPPKKSTPVGGCAMRRIQNPKISQVGSFWNILAAPWDPHLGTSPLPAVSHQRLLHQVRE